MARKWRKGQRARENQEREGHSTVGKGRWLGICGFLLNLVLVWVLLLVCLESTQYLFCSAEVVFKICLPIKLIWCHIFPQHEVHLMQISGIVMYTNIKKVYKHKLNRPTPLSFWKKNLSKMWTRPAWSQNFTEICTVGQPDGEIFSKMCTVGRPEAKN